MIQVDLKLAGTEFVVCGRHLDAGIAQVAQHLQQNSARITLTSNDVDVADDIGIATHSIGASGIWLHQVELKLRTDHGA